MSGDEKFLPYTGEPDIERLIRAMRRQEVGPSPGSFLGKSHTRTNWKKEYCVPRVFDRLSYQDWSATGKKNVIDRAKKRMEEILETFEPKPVTAIQDREINKILKEARKYYKDKGLL